MKPDTASRLLYQEAALRSFLRSDSIAQSFIQNTPNYNMEDLQQLYFASASIKSKKMLIEFVKISTKQLCISLRDKLPIFRYLNPDNISTDLTDDELMLLIHEASHSMSLDQQIGGHGNIAFLVAKNIIFNLVGVNATATLNSFLKTPDLGAFTARNKTFDSSTPSFGSTDYSSTSSPPFPMPPPPATSSPQYSMQQTATSLSPASTPSPYMPSYGSSPTIISTSIANLSFMSMNSSMPHTSNSFITVSTSTPHTTTHSVTQSSPTPAVTEKPHSTPESDVEPDFDARSNASESSDTRFEVIGDSGDSDDDNTRNVPDQNQIANYPDNRVDATHSAYDRDDDNMSIESNYDDDESDRSESNEVEQSDDDDEPKKLDNNDDDNDDEPEKLDDNDDDDDRNNVNNYQMMKTYETKYDDLYEQDHKSFEQEMLENDEIKRVFSISKLDDSSKNVPITEEDNDPHLNTPPSTPPPIPFLDTPESPRKFPLRKRPRKRKASRYADDNDELVNKNTEVQNKSWLESDVDFESNELVNKSVDATDGRMITNINQVIERSQPQEKKLFTDESVFDLMNDLKRKGVLSIPSSPRNITFSNIDT
ncbi:OrNVorf18-like protein [Chelonus insularis]|nr:OrNVorf18-like protein [Chelonus insularis]